MLETAPKNQEGIIQVDSTAIRSLLLRDFCQLQVKKEVMSGVRSKVNLIYDFQVYPAKVAWRHTYKEITYLVLHPLEKDGLM